MGSSVRPNDEDTKRLRVKITSSALLGGLGNLRTPTKSFTVTESREIARAPQSGQMTKMGSDLVRKFQPVRSRGDWDICPHALNI